MILTEWFDGGGNCVVTAEARFRRQDHEPTAVLFQPKWCGSLLPEKGKLEVDRRKMKNRNSLCNRRPYELGKILLTEEFDEGLMVLRRLLKWEMVDMTYVSVYKTTAGARRYDGKPLVNAPLFEDLPAEVGGRVPKARALRRLFELIPRRTKKLSCVAHF